MRTITCYQCLKPIPLLGEFKIARTEECPYCSTSLHCCRMCTFYDHRVYNECRENNAERIVDKEKSNFCDYFNLSDKLKEAKAKEELLDQAASLFKK